MIDCKRLMEVVEKHADTVTLAFLCDLVAVLGLRLKAELIDPPK